MVVPASGEKHGGVTHALHDLQSEHAGVEGERAVEIGDFQMHMTDAHTRVGYEVRFALVHWRSTLSLSVRCGPDQSGPSSWMKGVAEWVQGGTRRSVAETAVLPLMCLSPMKPGENPQKPP